MQERGAIIFIVTAITLAVIGFGVFSTGGRTGTTCETCGASVPAAAQPHPAQQQQQQQQQREESADQVASQPDVSPETTRATSLPPPPSQVQSRAASPSLAKPWAVASPELAAADALFAAKTFAQIEPVTREPPIPDDPPLIRTLDPKGDPFSKELPREGDYTLPPTRYRDNGAHDDVWKSALYEEACDVWEFPTECYSEQGSVPGFQAVAKRKVFDARVANASAPYPVICVSTKGITRFIERILPFLHRELKVRRSAGDKNKYGFVLLAACTDEMVGAFIKEHTRTLLHQRGQPVTEESELELIRFLEASPLLVRMFSGNQDLRLMRGGRLISAPFPLGVDYHTTEQYQSPTQQSRVLHGGTIKPMKERPPKVVVDFTNYAQGSGYLPVPEREGRHDVHNHFAQHGDFLFLRRHGQKVSINQLYEAYGSNAFVASPPGGGWECHRTYEALVRRSIPIVIEAAIAHEAYDGLPVIAVPRFDPQHVGATQLAAWQATAVAREDAKQWRWEKLSRAYWVRYIRGAARESTGH